MCVKYKMHPYIWKHHYEVYFNGKRIGSLNGFDWGWSFLSWPDSEQSFDGLSKSSVQRKIKRYCLKERS